jgi:hypothetical protein
MTRCGFKEIGFALPSTFADSLPPALVVRAGGSAGWSIESKCPIEEPADRQ